MREAYLTLAVCLDLRFLIGSQIWPQTGLFVDLQFFTKHISKISQSGGRDGGGRGDCSGPGV